MIRDMYIDKQIDVNNHDANYAFIQDFVVNRINGIRLTKETMVLNARHVGWLLPIIKTRKWKIIQKQINTFIGYPR